MSKIMFPNHPGQQAIHAQTSYALYTLWESQLETGVADFTTTVATEPQPYFLLQLLQMICEMEDLELIDFLRPGPGIQPKAQLQILSVVFSAIPRRVADDFLEQRRFSRALTVQNLVRSTLDDEFQELLDYLLNGSDPIPARPRTQSPQ
jgi:hypothetical protein